MEAVRPESLVRGAAPRDEPKVGHAGEAEHGLGHCMPFRARRERPASTSLIQTSLSMLLPPVAQSCLKCRYSASQVGSGCSSVTGSSSGPPLGSLRLRTVNVLGPHLHSD